MRSENFSHSIEKLFYRQTEDPEVLKFRGELKDLDQDQIYERLIDAQAEDRIDFSLECFDEIQRRRTRSVDSEIK